MVADVSHFFVEAGGGASDGFFVGFGFGADVVSGDLERVLGIALDDFFHFALVLESVDVSSKE